MQLLRIIAYRLSSFALGAMLHQSGAFGSVNDAYDLAGRSDQRYYNPHLKTFSVQTWRCDWRRATTYLCLGQHYHNEMLHQFVMKSVTRAIQREEISGASLSLISNQTTRKSAAIAKNVASKY